MAIQLDATQPRTFTGGMTARQMVEGFVNVRFAGANEVARQLELMAIRPNQNSETLLYEAAKTASKPIRDGYKQKIRNATGNLRKSITTRPPKKNYQGVGVAITGPLVTGPVGASPDKGSGNHAWLVEFGTGPRKPGSRGRRAYINVHQAINGRFGKMTNLGGRTNIQFERMGRGFYFLMGSKHEPTRQARRGSGYPHDFVPDSDGGTRPYFLESGETLAPMPAQHPMEKTISESSTVVMNTLINSMQGYMRTIMGGGNPLG